MKNNFFLFLLVCVVLALLSLDREWRNYSDLDKNRCLI